MGKHRSTSVDSIPFIYASVIAPIPDLIDGQGGKIGRPFRAAGVPIELVEEPENIVPIPAYLSLLQAAARETGDRSFGISVAERMRLEDLGPFGELITSAPSLREAIKTTCQMVQLYSNALSCWLTIEGETAYWHYNLAGGRDHREGRRLDCEHALVLYRTLIRLAAGSDWQPNEIWVEPAISEELHALQLRLGVDVRASSKGYALAFPRNLLDLPMAYARPHTVNDQQRLLDQLLSTKPDDSFVGMIEALIRSQLSAGYPDIETVAQSVGLSIRTLQRRLGHDGTVYSDVVDDVRCKLAMALLADPANNQLDTALAIGYHEASSFSRSFRRWTGKTPREYRRDLSSKAGLERLSG